MEKVALGVSRRSAGFPQGLCIHVHSHLELAFISSRTPGPLLGLEILQGMRPMCPCLAGPTFRAGTGITGARSHWERRWVGRAWPGRAVGSGVRGGVLSGQRLSWQKRLYWGIA